MDEYELTTAFNAAEQVWTKAKSAEAASADPALQEDGTIWPLAATALWTAPGEIKAITVYTGTGVVLSMELPSTVGEWHTVSIGSLAKELTKELFPQATLSDEDTAAADAQAATLAKFRTGYEKREIRPNLGLESTMRRQIRTGRADWRAISEYLARRYSRGATPVNGVEFSLLTAWVNHHREDGTYQFNLVMRALQGAFPGAHRYGARIWLRPMEPTYSSLATEARSHIPGSSKIAKCPGVGCMQQWPIFDAIQHLNDHHHWPFEQIADWLDDLHTSGRADLTVHPPKEETP